MKTEERLVTRKQELRALSARWQKLPEALSQCQRSEKGWGNMKEHNRLMCLGKFELQYSICSSSNIFKPWHRTAYPEATPVSNISMTDLTYFKLYFLSEK